MIPSYHQQQQHQQLQLYQYQQQPQHHQQQQQQQVDPVNVDDELDARNFGYRTCVVSAASPVFSRSYYTTTMHSSYGDHGPIEDYDEYSLHMTSTHMGSETTYLDGLGQDFMLEDQDSNQQEEEQQWDDDADVALD